MRAMNLGFPRITSSRGSALAQDQLGLPVLDRFRKERQGGFLVSESHRQHCLAKSVPALLVYTRTPTFELWTSVLDLRGYDVVVEPFSDEEIQQAVLKAAELQRRIWHRFRGRLNLSVLRRNPVSQRCCRE